MINCAGLIIKGVTALGKSGRDLSIIEVFALGKVLLAYCEMDTLAMVQIFKELRRLCGND